MPPRTCTSVCAHENSAVAIAYGSYIFSIYLPSVRHRNVLLSFQCILWFFFWRVHYTWIGGSWVFCIPASYYEHALYILCINTIMLCVFGSCSHYFFTRLFLFFLHPFVSLLFYISFICSYVVQCGQWRNGIFAVGQKRKSQPQSQCSFIPSSEHTHNFTAYFLFFILPFLSHRKMWSRMWWGGSDDSASAGVETWFIGSQF